MMTTLFSYALRSALCLTLLYVPYLLLLRRESFFRLNRLALLLIVVFSMVLPAIDFTLPVTERFVPAEVETIRAYTLADLDDSLQDDETALTAATPSVRQWLPLAYGLGVLMLLTLRLGSAWRLVRFVRRGTLWTRRDDDGMVVHCHIGDIGSFSWMNHIVISEHDYNYHRAEIMAHERAHVAHHHSLDMLLIMVCQLVQWFNPLVYLLADSLADVQEYEADADVVSQGIDAAGYEQLVIAKAAAVQQRSVLVNGFGRSHLRRRIEMLCRQRRSPWAMAKLAVLPVAAFCAVVVLAKTTGGVGVSAFSLPSAVLTDVVQDEQFPTDEEQVFGIDGQNAVAPSEMEVAEAAQTATTMPSQTESLPTQASSELSAQQPQSDQSRAATDTLSLVNPYTVNNSSSWHLPPQFPGGVNALKSYVKEHTAESVKRGAPVAGERVYLQFRIKADGSIDDIGLLRGTNADAYREAVKLVGQMPRWVPASRYDGAPTDSYFVLPVDFRPTPNE